MPAKKYVWAIMVGYVFSAYLKLPIIGVSLLGAAAAIIAYKQGVEKSEQKKAMAASAANASASAEDDDTYDE